MQTRHTLYDGEPDIECCGHICRTRALGCRPNTQIMRSVKHGQRLTDSQTCCQACADFMRCAAMRLQFMHLIRSLLDPEVT